MAATPLRHWLLASPGQFGDKGYISLQGGDATALAARASFDSLASTRHEEPPHTTDRQAVAAQALQHRDPVGQAEVAHEVGARPTPIAHQCLGPYSPTLPHTLAQPKVKMGL